MSESWEPLRGSNRLVGAPAHTLLLKLGIAPQPPRCHAFPGAVFRGARRVFPSGNSACRLQYLSPLLTILMIVVKRGPAGLGIGVRGSRRGCG